MDVPSLVERRAIVKHGQEQKEGRSKAELREELANVMIVTLLSPRVTDHRYYLLRRLLS